MGWLSGGDQQMKTATPRLSACLIVRDEEDFIETCLASLKLIADEIIVVDTGSADRTMEIAKRFSAKVIEFPWIGDFSAARNVGLEAATGDWIIFLDADEELVAEDIPEVKQLLLDQGQHAYYLKVINLLGQSEAGARRTEFPSVRLFRNIPQYRFQGRIHENLQPPPGYDEAALSNIRIIHRGYLDKVFGKRQKLNRNKRMLAAAGEQHDPDYERLILAQHNLSSGQYQEALAIFEALFDSIDEKHQDAVVRGIVLSSRQLGEADKALEWTQRGLALFPDYTDLEHLRGSILLDLKRYRESIESFTAVMALGDAPGRYHHEQGIGTVGAWEGLAFCYLGLGRYDIASAAFSRVLEYDAGRESAVFWLGSILLKAGHPWPAVRDNLLAVCRSDDPGVQRVLKRLEAGDLAAVTS